MLITALMMTVALANDGGVGDPDGVVATARPTPAVLDSAAVMPEAPSVGVAAQAAAPHGLTTDQQIERWVALRDPAETPFADDGEPTDDRKVHGMVDVGVGTGGYRSYGAAVSLPIGESARLDLSFRQIENGFYPYGHGYGYGYDYGAFGATGRPLASPADFGARRPDEPFGLRHSKPTATAD